MKKQILLGVFLLVGSIGTLSAYNTLSTLPEIFTQTPRTRILVSAARKIIAGLNRKRKYTRRHIAKLKRCIISFKRAKTEQDRRIFADHIIRYKKLAAVCCEEVFVRSEFLKIERLIDVRFKIIREIGENIFKKESYQQTYFDLPAAEKSVYQDEYYEFMKQSLEKHESLSKRLAIIEKKLIADDRDFFEKYSNITLLTVATCAFLFSGKIAIDLIGWSLDLSPYSDKAQRNRRKEAEDG